MSQNSASAGEPPDSLSVADRFDQLLQVGHRIVTSLSREAVFAATREAAAKLLRGQHSVIVEMHPDADPVVVAGDPHVRASAAIVGRAMESAVPLVAAPGMMEDGTAVSDGIGGTNARSVLAAPIPRRDERRYCLYTTHGQAGGVFDEEERRLAAFIAAVAGAALESSEGYGRLELAFDALNQAHGELKAAQAQLVQAAKLAALGQLGAGIAHELNQPIQSIQGFAQRVLRHPDAPVSAHRDELEIIVSATHRMDHIVQNMRKFARYSRLERQPVDPMVPLRDALSLLRQQLEMLGVEVAWRNQGPLVLVTGDTVQLQQVFLNLILNARDALAGLPAGRVRRLVLGSSVTQRGVVLTVEDSGDGVPDEIQGRIFEPFFTTKLAGEGMGLGLSISYGIIKDHGGELRYEPSARGAVFTVMLPCAAGDQG